MNASSSMGTRLARTIFALAAVMTVSFPAGAQLFRAYVSSTGSDGNPCNLPSPCRLLPAALAAVADGGEIWMLDSANYNVTQVEVAKSVTILAIPGAVGSVVATNFGHALHVYGADVKVTLRNLVIVQIGNGLDGVNFPQGAELTVEGCEIANVTGNGINAQATGSSVYVRNSIIRDVGGSGVQVGNAATATLSAVTIKRASASGVNGAGPATITVSDSILTANNPAGIEVDSTISAIALMVERTVLTLNGAGVRARCFGPCSKVDVKLVGNTFSSNGYLGVVAETDNANLSVTLDRNVLWNHPDAQIYVSGTPTIYTLGNNTFRVGADIFPPTAVFTPLAPQ